MTILQLFCCPLVQVYGTLEFCWGELCSSDTNYGKFQPAEGSLVMCDCFYILPYVRHNNSHGIMCIQGLQKHN